MLGFGPTSGPVEQFLVALIGGLLIANILLVQVAIAGPWAKRKITAVFWGKIGPNRIGPYGLLIIVADAIRFLSKEIIIPKGADRPAFDLAPILLPAVAILGFAVIPIGNGLQLADPETGLVFVFAVASIASIALVMGGYASNNKYSMMGALRAVAMNIAYEIPLVVTGVSVVLFTGTLRMSEIVAAQTHPLLTVANVTVPSWYGFVNPLAFVLFLVTSLSEVGRNPFDTAEAPTEIVAGYMTEYSGVLFVLLYLGEFLHIFLGGAIIATIFLGGPTAPISTLEFVPGIVWFFAKVWAYFLFTQWARVSIPRLRIDQVIAIGWKGLLVISFANLLLTAIIVGVVA
ncbi:complex I subunit 1/NuoH family protein [Natrinema sp. 74]|uniref:complex I subunit 1/NuoH family protein n=1 Tax=Natrinema sp. 74 TaxID=3384159 RepID=UPI0038D501E8